MRRDLWAYLGMVVVAVCTAIWSFESLAGLARLAGVGWMAWLLPVSIDGYALTSTRVWLRLAEPGSRAARYARFNAFTAIFLSIAGNTAYHALMSAGVQSLASSNAGWLVAGAAAVAAVPPATLYAVVHLWSLVRPTTSQLDPRVADAVGPAAVPASEPEALSPALAPASRTPSPPRRGGTRAAPPGAGTSTTTTGSAREYARVRRAAGESVTAPDLTREFPGLDKSAARRIIRSLNGRVPEPVG